MYKIMVVDDEENILKSIKRILSRCKDWEVETFDNPELALKSAMKNRFDLYI